MKNCIKNIGIAVLFLGLVGCSGFEGDQNDARADYGSYRVGKPYTVRGKRYVPKENYNYSRVGIASWYGPDFHGKKTANGARFNQYALTAAHKTLPMPCVILVTNLGNGRRAKLVVNDRGPFSSSRILDVSKRAAEVLGFRGKGTARVRVQVLRSESLRLKRRLAKGQKPVVKLGAVKKSKKSVRTSVVSSQSSTTSTQQIRIIPQEGAVQTVPIVGPRYYLETSRYYSINEARKVLENLGSYQKGIMFYDKGVSLYRVRFGPINSYASATAMEQNFLNQGYPMAIVKK